MNESKHKHLDGVITEMYVSGKAMEDVAIALNLAHSTVAYRIKMLGLSRSISESSVGKPKSEAHKKAVSESRIKKGSAVGSKNPNWRGGVTTETEKRVSAMKRDPRYKAWRLAVLSVGYCESCGSQERLEAHHILPKAQFPHLIHDINNGKCLCRNCHKLLHGAKSISGELLETLTVNDEGNQQPSVQSTKVQRLLEHSDMLNNQTSSRRESDDIVYPHQ
jgi:ribosomal protein L32